MNSLEVTRSNRAPGVRDSSDRVPAGREEEEEGLCSLSGRMNRHPGPHGTGIVPPRGSPVVASRTIADAAVCVPAPWCTTSTHFPSPDTCGAASAAWQPVNGRTPSSRTHLHLAWPTSRSGCEAPRLTRRPCGSEHARRRRRRIFALAKKRDDRAVVRRCDVGRAAALYHTRSAFGERKGPRRRRPQGRGIALEGRAARRHRGDECIHGPCSVAGLIDQEEVPLEAPRESCRVQHLKRSACGTRCSKGKRRPIQRYSSRGVRGGCIVPVPKQCARCCFNRPTTCEEPGCFRCAVTDSEMSAHVSEQFSERFKSVLIVFLRIQARPATRKPSWV